MSGLITAIALFIALFFYERRAFKNVIFLGIILIFLLLTFFFQDTYLLTADNYVTGYFYAIIFFLVPAIFLLLSFGMFFSSKILLEKEGRKLRNLLLPGIALVILVVAIGYSYVLLSGSLGDRALILFVYLFGLFMYFAFFYTSTAAYAFLYNIAPITYKPDFIIALGSGLIGDKVPPLLASRLNKAADVYFKYKQTPRIITSGGQGADELVSESFAMREYLIKERGIPAEHIFMEDQSVNTLQNMQFSKAIMDAEKPDAKAVFVTNEFHLFRASLYARKANISGDGVGSKTAFYYVPNAFTREFIALLVMYKKWHLACLILYTAFCGLLFFAY